MSVSSPLESLVHVVPGIYPSLIPDLSFWAVLSIFQELDIRCNPTRGCLIDLTKRNGGALGQQHSTALFNKERIFISEITKRSHLSFPPNKSDSFKAPHKRYFHKGNLRENRGSLIRSREFWMRKSNCGIL